MISPYKEKVTTGVKKSIGQLKKVLLMIESNDYCMDILQQVRAAEGLLTSVSSQIMESHLHTCGAKIFKENKKEVQEKAIKELLIAFKASKK